MARWHPNVGILQWAPKPIEGYPGWVSIDCGCCNGIEWGGDYPRECRDCGGAGWLAKHIKSGMLADYPGGPARGRVLGESE